MASFRGTDARVLHLRRTAWINFAIIILGFNVLALVTLKNHSDIGMTTADAWVPGIILGVTLKFCFITCAFFFSCMKIYSRYLEVFRIEIRGDHVTLYKRLRTIEISVSDLERVIVRKIHGQRVVHLWFALKTPHLWQWVAVSKQLDQTEIWNLIEPRLSAHTHVLVRNGWTETLRPDALGGCVAFGLATGSFVLGQYIVAPILLSISASLYVTSYFASKKSDWYAENRD